MYTSTIAGSPTGNEDGYIGNVRVPNIPVGDGFLPIMIPVGRDIFPSLSPYGSNTHRVSGIGARCHLYGGVEETMERAGR